MEQRIILRSATSYEGKIPPVPVGRLLTMVPEVIRECTSMAFQRRSRIRGKPPNWLRAVSDVRLLDVSNNGDTVLYFDAPLLGEAASVLYDQIELFPNRPAETDTGFDLLGDVLADVAAGNENSERFDSPLLNRLCGFRHVLNGEYQEMLVNAVRYTAGRPAVVDKAIIRSARSLYAKTPPTSRVRVVGVLDTVRVSTQTFGLKVADGREVKGVFPGEDFDAVLALLRSRQQVVVRGEAVFRPSGQLLLVDADDIETAERESSIWSKVPEPHPEKMALGHLVARQGPRTGLAAIVGKWPGGETDEEIAEALREIS